MVTISKFPGVTGLRLRRNIFFSIFGPRLKAEWTYRISLVRPCVRVCVRPERIISETVHWIVLKFSGMFRIKILRKIAWPDFPKKFPFPRKTRVYGQKRAKMPKIDVFRTLRENATLTFSNFSFKMTLQSTYTTPNHPYPRQNLRLASKTIFICNTKLGTQ